MDKQFVYNERKANPTLVWLLFLFFGWSYGSLGKIGTQILYYITLGGLLSFTKFKEEVHHYIYDENDNYVGPCDIARVYGPMVKSKQDVINMVDPSGGPYLTDGMEIMGKTIKEFKSNKDGYLIITK